MTLEALSILGEPYLALSLGFYYMMELMSIDYRVSKCTILYMIIYALGREKRGAERFNLSALPQVNWAKQICADVCLLPRMLTRTQLMRCHFSGTSLEAKKCQF